ncbi:hypothetical protein TIFTF001_046945 [Ficus carica]|uniref:Ubiquitin-like protease family profile domain-containing protein n=1 Tax=Ficus carica TaxID=3494 RepID=A0AA88CV12_FICCA|nr:hypothetical protein TIFTF001_046945 [Ficus carica]
MNFVLAHRVLIASPHLGRYTDGLVQIVDDLDRCRTFPWGRRSFHYLLIHVQKLNIAEKSANAFEKKKTTWACPGFILPLMLLPFECIPALTPKFAMVQKDVIEPVPRICHWKMNFKKKKAPTLEDVLQRVGDTKDIRSILTPTPREQQTAYMQSFVPDDDESDVIIDQWTMILENELSSIFWENVWYADLEGRQNFLRLHVSTEEVQREDLTEVENIQHENVRCEESRPQHASSPMGQSRSMPFHSPLADESMRPQASHLVDDPRVLHKLKVLEEKIEKMDREVKSQYSQLEKILIERLDKMMNIIESGNEDVGLENDGGFENDRDGDVNIDNTELNVLYYHSPISSNDCANEEDVYEHMEEATYGLRIRQHKYSDIINQNAVVLDEVFGQLLVGKSYACDAMDDYLRKYISGEVPKMGKSWKGTKALYFPFNVGDKENLQNKHLPGGKHWVTVKVDLVELELVVFDCNIGCYNEIQMDKFMKPLQKMIPLMLRESGFFNDMISHINTPWPYRRPCDHPQNISGDCAVYAIKYIEFDMEGIKLNLIDDDMIEFYRKKMAIEIFHNHWVP